MQVYDFVGMYEIFVHHDRKKKLLDLYKLIFNYHKGKVIFKEYSDFGYRGGFKKQSTEKHLSIEVSYRERYSKGIKVIDEVAWSDLDVDTDIKNGIRVDPHKLAEMTNFIIEHTYVQHNNSIYRQQMGIAMGMNNSPQMAHLYCAMFETEFMLRTAAKYYTKPKHERSQYEQARLACIFNSMRYIDDINSPATPKGCDFYELLTDNREQSGSDGVYPANVLNENGDIVVNPMEVKLERHGMTCTYLDFSIKLESNGTFSTSVYQKRDEMPVFKNYRRFPHIYSRISKAAKHAVMASQLHRFAILCNSEQEFTRNVTRLLSEMLHHGYKYELLRRHIKQFELSYTARQWLTYKRVISKHRQIWRQLLVTCDRLARHINTSPSD